MTRPAAAAASTLLAIPLVLGLLADAHAATFTLEPAVVEVGGSIVFSFTTEVGAWPDGWDGAEYPADLHFNGPCTNGVFIGGPAYGLSYDVPFPGPAWSNFIPACSTLSKPGNYVATFSYDRIDASGAATIYHINLPFVVLPAPVELDVTPQRIPVGGTVSLSADVNPGQPATLSVLCPDLGFTTSEAFDVDQSVSWPSAFFDDPRCDSSLPGEYTALLSTEVEGNFDSESFWVYGDRDGDGLLDPEDNCPDDPNAGQEDADGDDQGDVCDPDDDGDGVGDESDNCPDDPNTSQANLDADGDGDACDPDLDGDGIANESDNCPNVANPEQQEECVADPNDTDGDGQANLSDNCPDVFNPAQQDPDGDGIGTACDLDIDGDGLGNDDEAAAGTDPLLPDALDEDGITTLWAGTVIEAGGFVEDGETVGVVVDADPDVENASIRVIDPVGSPYLLRDFLGLTPFAFAFIPILPGDWTIEAALGNGTVQTAVIHVIPEPDSVAAAITAILALGLAARRAGASGTR